MCANSTHCKVTCSPLALMDVINCQCKAVGKACNSHACTVAVILQDCLVHRTALMVQKPCASILSYRIYDIVDEDDSMKEKRGE